MRARALLFLAALATALGIGAADASAITLWTTTAHTTRATVGTAIVATNSGPVRFTLPAGTTQTMCTHSELSLISGPNTGAFSIGFTVTAGTFSGCTPLVVRGTFTTPWQLTAESDGVEIGPSTRFLGTLDTPSFDINNFVGAFTGQQATNITATEPKPFTAPICFDLAEIGPMSHPTITTLTVDAKYCFTGATDAKYSLT